MNQQENETVGCGCIVFFSVITFLGGFLMGFATALGAICWAFKSDMISRPM